MEDLDDKYLYFVLEDNDAGLMNSYDWFEFDLIISKKEKENL